MGYRDSNTNYRADIKSVRFCFVGCSRRVGAVIGRPEIMRDIGKTQRAVKEKWADIKSAHRDRRKSPVGTFPPKHPPCAHGLLAKPTNRTLVRIEVFFAPGNPWQKTDFKSPLRGQIRFFRQAEWADIKSAHRLFIYSAIISQSLFVNSTGFSIGIPSMSSAWEYRISAYSPTLSLLSSA